MNAYPSSSQVTQKNSPSVYKQTKSSRSIKFPLRGKTQHDTTPASGLCNGIIVDFMDGLVCIYPRHDSDRRRERAQARSAARLRIGAAHDHLCARRHHASAIDGGDSIGKGAQPRRPARQRTGSRLVRTWLRRAQSTEYPAVEHNTRLVGAFHRRCPRYQTASSATSGSSARAGRFERRCRYRLSIPWM
jgi:hypothetical protein